LQVFWLQSGPLPIGPPHITLVQISTAVDCGQALKAGQRPLKRCVAVRVHEPHDRVDLELTRQRWQLGPVPSQLERVAPDLDARFVDVFGCEVILQRLRQGRCRGSRDRVEESAPPSARNSGSARDIHPGFGVCNLHEPRPPLGTLLCRRVPLHIECRQAISRRSDARQELVDLSRRHGETRCSKTLGQSIGRQDPLNLEGVLLGRFEDVWLLGLLRRNRTWRDGGW
jgi:hypothetical protein